MLVRRGAEEQGGKTHSGADKRIFWMDAARAFAIATVVWIHSVDTLSYGFNLNHRPFGWLEHGALQSVGRLGVPLFLMLSGALLLPRREEKVIKFYKHRIPRLFIALVGFSYIFYILGRHFFGDTSPPDFMRAIITGYLRYSYQFWYLYIILGLYLASPFLTKMVCACSDLELGIIMLFAFLFSFVAPTIQDFTSFPIMPPVDQSIFTSWLAYYIAGYWVAVRGSLSRLSPRGLFLILFLDTCALLAAQTLLHHLGKLTGPGVVWYQSAFVAIASVCTFELFRKIPNKAGATLIGKFISVVAAASFTIYIVQVSFLWPWQLHSGYTRLPFIVASIICWACTMFLSTCVYFLFRRVPLLRYVAV